MFRFISYLAVVIVVFGTQLATSSDKSQSQLQLVPYWQEKIAGLPYQSPGPFWSPDSRYVCFQALAQVSKPAQFTGDLLVVDVINKKIVWDSANHPKRQGIPGRKQVIDVKWTNRPDGLLWVESTGDVWSLNLASGHLQHLTSLNGLFETNSRIPYLWKHSACISRYSTHLYYFRVEKGNSYSLRRLDYSDVTKDEELWSSWRSRYQYSAPDSGMVISMITQLPDNKLLFILQEDTKDFPRSIVHVLNLEKTSEIDITPVPAPGVFILHEASLLDESATLLLTGLANERKAEQDPDYVAVYTYNLVSKQLTLKIKDQGSVLVNWRILHPERLLMALVSREEKKGDQLDWKHSLAVYSKDLTKLVHELPLVDWAPYDYSISPCGNYIAQACINKNYGLVIQRIVRLKK